MHLGIACFITNEARFLREWIEFHRLVGFNHFLFFDNESHDRPEKVLLPYLEAGLAEYIPWENRYGITEFHRAQLDAYQRAIDLSRERLDWLAILDCDEFLFPVQDKSLAEVLNRFQSFGGVVVNWQTFGTSGIWDLGPGECLIEKLVWKRASGHPGNAHVKTIFQPRHVRNMETQHHCRFHEGFHAVDTGAGEVSGPHARPVRTDLLRINHYMLRTRRFFEEQKKPMMIRSGRYARRREVLEDEQAFRAEEDTAIHRFLPELKNRLFPPG